MSLVWTCHRCGKRSKRQAYWASLYCRTSLEGAGEPFVAQESTLCPECNDALQKELTAFMEHGIWVPWSLEQFKELAKERW